MEHSGNPRFELSINNEKICTAGVELMGVLSASLDWARRSPQDVPDHIKKDPSFDINSWIGGGCSVRVGGIDGRTFVDWCDREVKIGDEIRIRILPPGESEPPASRRDESTVMADCRNIERDQP